MQIYGTVISFVCLVAIFVLVYYCSSYLCQLSPKIFVINFKFYTHGHLCIVAMYMNYFDNILSTPYMAAIFVPFCDIYVNNFSSICVRNFTHECMCTMHIHWKCGQHSKYLFGSYSYSLSSYYVNNSLNIFVAKISWGQLSVSSRKDWNVCMYVCMKPL